MQISVSGRNVEITPTLRDATEEKISRLTKYLNGMEKAEVRFSEQRNPSIANKNLCEVTLEGHGYHVRAKGAATDALTAVDLVVDKLSGQLHKLKNKIRSKPYHHTQKNGDTQVPASQLIEEVLPGSIAVLEGPGELVKIKHFDLESVTVDDAINRLDLVGHDFYFYRDAETGRTAVIYRRDDGGVGVIHEN